jgi:uncharacterized membrane protein (UPF0127 family)
MKGFLLVALAGAMVACGSSAAPLQTVSARGFPLGDLRIARSGHTEVQLTVEIADNDKAWQKGLMGVRTLPRDQGMAFDFGHQVNLGFWMKDTLIPLDIAFADAQGAVVDVQHMVPCTADPCPIYYAAQPYALAVETASGVLTGASVRAGDTMTLIRRSHAVRSP